MYKNYLVVVFLCLLSSNFHPQKEKLNTIHNEKEYFNALEAADSITFVQEFEKEFLLLLDEIQKQDYLQFKTIKNRKEYIKLYWEAVNPNPLLPENDRLLDHIRRRNYARKNFPSSKPPFYDDRGKYYIKYGKPSYRFEDKGGFNGPN